MTRQRAHKLPQGLKIKVTIPDCCCHSSVDRHRPVECDTKNLQIIGNFYVGPSNSNVVQPSGSSKALPSAEQSRDKLIWNEEKPTRPEPVLASDDCDVQTVFVTQL